MKQVLRMLLVIGLGLLSGCDTVQPKKVMSDIMSKIKLTGYEPFEWPRNFGGLPLAGAVVQISKTQGFRYQTTLQKCGLDEEVLTPVPGDIAIPSFTVNRNADIEVAPTLLKAVSLGASAKAAHRIEVAAGSSTNEMILPWDVMQSAKKHHDQLMERCGELLMSPDVFWVSDALKSQTFRLSFYDERGAKIKVKQEALPEFVSGTSAEAHIGVTSQGEVEVHVPVYLAFRSALPSELLTGKIATASASGKVVPFTSQEVTALTLGKLKLPSDVAATVASAASTGKTSPFAAGEIAVAEACEVFAGKSCPDLPASNGAVVPFTDDERAVFNSGQVPTVVRGESVFSVYKASEHSASHEDQPTM